MTASPGPPTDYVSEARAADLVLARLHLRLGSLGLARAELETLAGRHGLDDDGILDLAEARWRTGDLAGASEAAGTYLEARPEHPVALVIVAEAQAHLGRPSEARRLAGRALASNGGPIDPIFAGMPRSSIWPVDPGAAPEPTGLFFDDPVMPTFGSETAVWGAAGEGDGEVVPPALSEYDGPGLWDAHADTVAPVLPAPAELLDRARTALAGERPGQAAAGLALAIRAAPGLAPAVLDLLAGRPEPVLALVRGDAHRIVGHEAEALRDYVTAVAAIGLERRSDDGRNGDGGHDDGEHDDDEAPGVPDAEPAAGAPACGARASGLAISEDP